MGILDEMRGAPAFEAIMQRLMVRGDVDHIRVLCRRDGTPEVFLQLFGPDDASLPAAALMEIAHEISALVPDGFTVLVGTPCSEGESLCTTARAVLH